MITQHAFDSAGRLYNQQGKLEPWWTNATSEGFDKIQKCISDQYSSMFIFATCRLFISNPENNHKPQIIRLMMERAVKFT